MSRSAPLRRPLRVRTASMVTVIPSSIECGRAALPDGLHRRLEVVAGQYDLFASKTEQIVPAEQ